MPRKVFLLKIIEKQRETPSAYSFTVGIPEELKSQFRFIAGQYITVHITDVNGIQHSRHYSICSPTYSQNISFCVKRIQNGLVSNLLCDEYHVGNTLQLSASTGEFLLDDSILKNYRNLVFVTGGSGITPIKSMIDQALNNNFKGNIFLIYASRNVSNKIFHQHFLNIKRDKCKFILTVDEATEGWSGEVGPLTPSKIEELFCKYRIPYEDTCFFISGPGVVIDNVSRHLEANNVDETQIKFEKFFTSLFPGNISTESHLIQIKFKRKLHPISIPPNTTILDATLNAGINVDHNCKTGSCLNCAAVLRSGKVSSANRQQDNSKKILTCQSYPLDNTVVVDFDKSIIQSLSANRNVLIISSFLLSFMLLLFFSHPKNDFLLAKGEFNTGHDNLECGNCHKPAPGTTRQQLQRNAKSFLGPDDKYASFGRLKVGNKECLNCHTRPNDVHPTHRFMEPRFISAREEISPENCISCHSEHLGKRVTIEQVGFCMHCHQDIRINNDPLDLSHAHLISRNQWDTCLQCHDFHGNHIFELATSIKDTITVERIENYFDGGKDPYSKIKKYITDMPEENKH